MTFTHPHLFKGLVQTKKCSLQPNIHHPLRTHEDDKSSNKHESVSFALTLQFTCCYPQECYGIFVSFSFPPSSPLLPSDTCTAPQPPHPPPSVTEPSAPLWGPVNEHWSTFRAKWPPRSLLSVWCYISTPRGLLSGISLKPLRFLKLLK